MGSGKKHKRDRDSSATAPSSRSSASHSSTAGPSSSRSSRSSAKEKLRAPSPPVFRPDDRRTDRERERERRHRNADASSSKSSSDRRRDERSREPRERSRERHSRRDRIEVFDSDDSDVVEVPVAPPAPKISDPVVPDAPPAPKTRRQQRSPSPVPENGAGDCLSVAETNKLRLKLGLKPLEVDDGPSSTTTSSGASSAAAMLRDPANAGLQAHKDEWGEFLHKPAANAAAKLDAEKLREKIRQRKERRMHEERLQRVGKLGDDGEADDLNGWLERSRDKERARAEAEKRARQLAEQDGDQDDEDAAPNAYGERNLAGLRVDHEVHQFGEGKTVILTLKDADVLDDGAGDTLHNVNMVDDERYRKSNANKKKNPNAYGYDVYEEQLDDLGQPVGRNLLSKYDEELDEDGGRRTFAIGETADIETDRKRKMLEIRTKLAGKRLETLDEPLTRLASDTYTEQEMSEKFRKTKRKVKKLRAKLKVEDLVPLAGDAVRQDHGRRRREASEDKEEPQQKQWPGKTEPVDEEDDDDLEQILAKARRLKQKDALIVKTIDAAAAVEIKTEPKTEPSAAEGDANIVLNATAEFCRTLGDIPTYGMSGNRDGDAGDMMAEGNSDEDDMETDAQAAQRAAAVAAAALAERSTGTWNSVNTDVIDVTGDDDDEDHATNDRAGKRSEAAILDEEPDVGSGMGAALKLALSKGYLEREDQNRPSNTRMAHLQAKNYSIDDKAHADDEKFNRRDRFQHGPLSDFREKESYRPNVKLEYIDDSGRQLNEKEAFRYLSHKFHGKGPGKNKIEKRLKKNEQDGLLMKMSSTDTPLGTLTMLKHKQLETHSPYIVLSGSKQLQAAGSSITKHK